jgi:hypothetical protein
MAAFAKTKSIPMIRPLQVYEGTLDLTTIPKGTAPLAEQDITVAGVKAADMVVSFMVTDAAVFGILNARVKADNTISIIPVSTDSDTDVDPASTLNYRMILCPAI